MLTQSNLIPTTVEPVQPVMTPADLLAQFPNTSIQDL